MSSRLSIDSISRFERVARAALGARRIFRLRLAFDGFSLRVAGSLLAAGAQRELAPISLFRDRLMLLFRECGCQLPTRCPGSSLVKVYFSDSSDLPFFQTISRSIVLASMIR